jgi:hypothetical protein
MTALQYFDGGKTYIVMNVGFVPISSGTRDNPLNLLWRRTSLSVGYVVGAAEPLTPEWQSARFHVW